MKYNEGIAMKGSIEAEDILIKKIPFTDTSKLYALRIESLDIDSFAFGTHKLDQEKIGMKNFARILVSDSQDEVLWGAYYNEMLVGMIGLSRELGLKKKHKATIWGLYVGPNFRGLKISSRLMDMAIDHAKNHLKLKSLMLTTEAYNTSALKLYESRGFVMWGIEPESLYIDGVFHDQGYMSLALNN